MTLPILVLADDLTGAADSAAAFGGTAEMWVSFAGDELPQGDLVAVDTNSRYLRPEEAAQVVRDVVGAATGTRLYKKIDSTLRGNVAAEVAAVLKAANSPLAVVAPAFPDTGRTTVDGVVTVHGAHQGDLTTMLRQGGMRVGTADLRTVRNGSNALAELWNELATSGVQAVVCDAETNDDLRSIRLATDLLTQPPVLVGSAGLLRTVVDHAHPGACVRGPCDGATLVVSGSATELNAHQVRELREQTGVTVVELGAPFGAQERAEALNRTRSALEIQDVLLVPDAAEPVRAECSRAVERGLATVAADLLITHRALLGAAILTGGATARAVLDASGARRLAVRGEIEAGVVLSTAPELDDLVLVTKSGSFGDPGTLNRARLALRGEDGRRPVTTPLD